LQEEKFDRNEELYLKYCKTLTCRLIKIAVSLDKIVLDMMTENNSPIVNLSHPYVKQVLQHKSLGELPNIVDNCFEVLLVELRDSKHFEKFDYSLLAEDSTIIQFEGICPRIGIVIFS